MSDDHNKSENDSRPPENPKKPQGGKQKKTGIPVGLGEIFGVGSGALIGFEAGQRAGGFIAHDIAGLEPGTFAEVAVVVGAELAGVALTGLAGLHMARLEPNRAVFFGARAIGAAGAVGGAAVGIKVVLDKLKEMDAKIDELAKTAAPSEVSSLVITPQESGLDTSSNTQIFESAAASPLSSLGVTDFNLGQQSFAVEPFGAYSEPGTVSTHTHTLDLIGTSDYTQETDFASQEINGPSLDT
jgi:hypothetical protein